jgi:hypothetical protein
VKKFFMTMILVAIIISFLPASQIFAMPEYATRVGEPCGTCHTSASGGGLRNPRGQAWVAEGKPNTVPTIEESLKILGVNAVANPADYTAPTTLPLPAAPLTISSEHKKLLSGLLDSQGN